MPTHVSAFNALVHWSNDSDLVDPVTEAEDETAYLNISRIIKTYISSFAKVEPATALQYAYLVALGSDAPDGSGERQKTACLELIRDIVLASRAWSKLLGSVRADGTKEVSSKDPFLS